MAKKEEQENGGKKHPGGRPTKYKPEYCDIGPYIKACKAKKVLPTICGYAMYLGVCEQTITNWGKEHKEFLGSLKRLLTIEKVTLINKGLKGEYNSTIAKLLLSANHGLKERSDVTSGDNPIERPPLTVEEIKRRIAEYEAAGTGIDYRSIEGRNDGGNSRRPQED